MRLFHAEKSSLLYFVWKSCSPPTHELLLFITHSISMINEKYHWNHTFKRECNPISDKSSDTLCIVKCKIVDLKNITFILGLFCCRVKIIRTRSWFPYVLLKTSVLIVWSVFDVVLMIILMLRFQCGFSITLFMCSILWDPFWFSFPKRWSLVGRLVYTRHCFNSWLLLLLILPIWVMDNENW